MSKNNAKEQKKDNNYIKVIFSVLIIVIGILAEFYIMINLGGEPVYLCIFGMIILIMSYILISSIVQIQYNKMREEREEHDNLFKSQKASYLIIRKSFDEIFQRLESLEKSIKLPTEELITAQKAIAKVNISRSKENTDALMNSNDKLLEKVFEFEDMLDENNKKLLESQNQITEQQMKDVMLKQQEINATIKELQLSLKNEMLQAINTIATTQPQNIPQQMSQNISQVEISKVDQAIPIKIEGDTELKFEEPVIEEPVIEEPIAEEPLMEEPIAEEPLMEEPIGEEPLMEEPIAEEPLMEEPIIEEPIVEEPIMEEAPAEEVPPMPDLSDPNKVMTPEEIAALIANTGAEEPVAEDLVAEEPVAEEPIAEEPIMEEAPVEEAPPMPDLSDPNKVMTPDEIAALIANM
ncbi:MAG: hypothetical protein SO445_05005 [Lachnospiraceae bacterium]|nr:hypothetical protein [Lachnospiraceae bacterium]MDY4617054.1 hypothetical protein [Lachnospiraceae bacterium]